MLGVLPSATACDAMLPKPDAEQLVLAAMQGQHSLAKLCARSSAPTLHPDLGGAAPALPPR